MKIMMPLFILCISIASHAGQGKGGGNFDYMKSLTSLGPKHFSTILEDNGANFISEVIMPNLLTGAVHILSENKSAWSNLKKKDVPSSGLTKMWKAFVGSKNGVQLEYEIKRVKISACACPTNLQDEYEINHACSFKAEQKICLDLPKINKVDFHELTAMIWHEFTHLRIGDADHDNGMTFYIDILTKSQKGSGLKTSDIVNSFKNSCKINNVSNSYKSTSLMDCLKEGLKSKEEKTKVKFHTVAAEFSFPQAYNSKKSVACTFYGNEEDYAWLRWLSQFTFLSKKFHLFDFEINTGTEMNTSSVIYAPEIVNPIQKIYSTDKIFHIKTQRLSIDECIKHAHYVQARDGIKLFSKSVIRQGKFSLTLSEYDSRNLLERIFGE